MAAVRITARMAIMRANVGVAAQFPEATLRKFAIDALATEDAMQFMPAHVNVAAYVMTPQEVAQLAGFKELALPVLTGKDAKSGKIMVANLCPGITVPDAVSTAVKVHFRAFVSDPIDDLHDLPSGDQQATALMSVPARKHAVAITMMEQLSDFLPGGVSALIFANPAEQARFDGFLCLVRVMCEQHSLAYVQAKTQLTWYAREFSASETMKGTAVSVAVSNGAFKDLGASLVMGAKHRSVFTHENLVYSLLQRSDVEVEKAMYKNFDAARKVIKAENGDALSKEFIALKRENDSQKAELKKIKAELTSVGQQLTSARQQLAKRPRVPEGGGGNFGAFPTRPDKSRPCFDFQKGRCNRGDSCKFAHGSAGAVRLAAV